ncbi:MAG: YabP/YqfC family sporulation protein [Clostridia bacterium]|nr:YabP/YqfC family sporulation protein [Clostridia bacterium]
MDLIMEVSDITGLPVYLTAGSYKYSVIGGQAVHISGVKNIWQFDSDKAVLIVQKNKRLVIKGQELYIKKMYNTDVVVCGKISSVSEE